MNGIYAPHAPAIPGLTFRPFKGAGDYAALAAVHEGVREWDRVDPCSPREGIPTADDLAQAYADVPPGSPDMLVVAAEGTVVGYNRLMWWTEQDGSNVYLHLGWLLPQWRGRGIGTSMLRWAEGRLRVIAAGHRAEGRLAAGPLVFGTNASSTEREATALVLREGYTAYHRLSDMAVSVTGEFPVTKLPAALAVRPVAPEQYRAIYAAWKDAWAGLPLMRPPSEQDYRDFIGDNVDVPDFDPSLWQVAWDGDEVAGLVFCRVRRGVGIVPEVAVCKGWQRRGVARALLPRGMRAMAARGVPEIRILTDADDSQGARSLYESAGFRELKQHVLYRKPFLV